MKSQYDALYVPHMYVMNIDIGICQSHESHSATQAIRSNCPGESAEQTQQRPGRLTVDD